MPEEVLVRGEVREGVNHAQKHHPASGAFFLHAGMLARFFLSSYESWPNLGIYIA